MPASARPDPASRKGSWCIALAAVLLLAPALVAAKDWQIYQLGGREYVSDENVAKFYGFERFAKQGDDRIFKHPTLIMTWKIGSESIYVNNIKFCLSFPIVENGGMAMLSTVDLAKLVDPVVRPSYIRKPIEFDTVVIDAGHGAHDTGAKGPYGREKDYTLDTSLRLSKALQARGFKTVLTRDTDIFLTLNQRVELANRYKNAIFISIHYNSSGAKTSNGIETYALAPQGTTSTNGGSPWNSPLTGNTSDAENIALATAVHAHVIADIKAVDRGIKRARFNVLRGINKPGILFEGGFVTSPSEGKLIDDPAHRERLANSIAEAVVRFKTAVGKR
ncbi:MAG TPA: N-acetylmuramoyl-L-alanine amidase [Bacteroidia bacterium]|nr:N-acetylmuramoyl-L-alanine amidase [Bacteroidia bacterium]